LVKLHEKYQLILEEGLTENHPDVSWQHDTLTFTNDKVKLELDTKYIKWNDESLELTLTNEVGARFVAEISGIENILRLRNEMIRKVDELICLNSTKANQIEKVWEPEEEDTDTFTNWDDDSSEDVDNDDDEDTSDSLD
jgi:hypothetical protein